MYGAATTRFCGVSGVSGVSALIHKGFLLKPHEVSEVSGVSAAFLSLVSVNLHGTGGTGGTALIDKGFFCATTLFSGGTGGTDGTTRRGHRHGIDQPRQRAARRCDSIRSGA